VIYEDPDQLGYFSEPPSTVKCREIVGATVEADIEYAALLSRKGYGLLAEDHRTKAGYSRDDLVRDDR
jgi:hypothetical protein